MDTLLTRYILTVPLLILFKILKKALNGILLGYEDFDYVTNSVADSLIEGGYTTEEAIQAVFNHLELVRIEPSYGECGFRCDGRCQTCIRIGGGGAGLSWNESGYTD